MIFKDINTLFGKNEKKFFIEKINIINKLVVQYSRKNKIDYENIVVSEEKVLLELTKIGILSKSKDLPLLKKLIKVEYDNFIRSLTFYNKHKKETNYFLKKFYNSYRKEKQQERKNSTNPKIIDLFCGAGGFSWGFVREGYQIELANDIEPATIETYKYNHPNLESERILSSDIREIENHIDTYIKTDIDVIIGGPPCQSFSSANQQRVIDDPRNILYKYYVKAVEKVRPKFILMENVRGMIKVADQVVDDFNKIEYEVMYKLYDSSDFSVPQKRIRLIYIGVRKDYLEEKNITPELLMQDIENELKDKKRFILKDALENIKPLACPKIKNTTEVDCEESGKKVDVNIYKNKSNEYIQLINNNQEIDFTFNHKARYQNENNQKIFETLSQGSDSTCKSISDIMPYSHRNHVFKDKYFKLIESVPCRTITAHMKMDCHSHIHPTQTRSLTPREAARIQSFPDNYLFMGAYLKTYMHIGNAVPPLMGQVFAKVYKKYLK
jgi:DNA (cytosine-5)-methyltransferase 1